MKKIGAFLLLTVLISSFVFAQATNDSNTTISFEDAKTNIASKTDPLVDKEIEIPDNLKLVVNIFLLGIGGAERTLSVSLLVVLIVLWILGFIFLANIIGLTPFFHGGTKWPAAALIVILFALSGALRSIANFALNVGNVFKFLEDWSAGALVFVIVLAIIIALIVEKLFKILKEHLEISEAHQEGLEAGVELGFLKRMREMFTFTRKK